MNQALLRRLLSQLTPFEHAEGGNVAQNVWGQSKTYGPGWIEDAPNTVLQIRNISNPPEVVTVTLAAKIKSNAPGPTHRARFCWSITAGVGGASRTWLVDVRQLQQLSLPAQTLDISLVAKKLFENGTFLVPPGPTLDVSAFIALGNTSTERSTFTQSILNLASAQSADLEIPAGAASWRLTGDPSLLTSPFVANVIIFPEISGYPYESYAGDKLLDAFYTGAWIPLIGSSNKLVVANGTANAITFNIEWGLDL